MQEKLEQIIKDIGWGNVVLELTIKNGEACVAKIIKTEQTVILDKK
jgi:hypothetical protein